MALPSVDRLVMPALAPALRIRSGPAAHGSIAPLVASTERQAVRRGAVDVLKAPPTMSLLPSGASTIAATLPSALGAQPISEPSVALKAARCDRAVPPMSANAPPT